MTDREIISRTWQILSEIAERIEGLKDEIFTSEAEMERPADRPFGGWHFDQKTRLPVRNEPAEVPGKLEPWRPEMGKVYWTIDIQCVFDTTWNGDQVDIFRLALGIVFRTEEEAIQKRKEMGL